MHSFTFQIFIIGKFTMDVVGDALRENLCVLSQNLAFRTKTFVMEII